MCEYAKIKGQTCPRGNFVCFSNFFFFYEYKRVKVSLETFIAISISFCSKRYKFVATVDTSYLWEDCVNNMGK